jgi:hypothetical protein
MVRRGLDRQSSRPVDAGINREVEHVAREIEISNSDDVIDVRDVIARFETLENLEWRAELLRHRLGGYRAQSAGRLFVRRV